MARLAILMALAHSAIINGLPAHVHDERAIKLSSEVEVTTIYRSVVSTLQSASITESPTIIGVGFTFAAGFN